MHFGLTLLLTIGLMPIIQSDQAALLTSQQQRELDRILHVINSEQNDAQTRRFGAESLLKSELPTRIESTVTLLSNSVAPGTPMAVCEAIAAIARRQPELVDERLVQPLLDLLGNQDAKPSAAAATALAEFRDHDVAATLGAIASDQQKPIETRLAAIDALALNIVSPSAVSQLIVLTTATDQRIVERVLEALRPASRLDFGNDVEAWRNWWRQKSALSEERWLRDRLELGIERFDALREKYRALQTSTEARQRLVAQRFNALLRTIYRLTPQQAQKEAKLAQWLSDPVAEYRLCALGLIREQITEGNAPAPPIREAVKNAFTDASARVRIDALEIIGNLKDPNDTAAVLKLLPGERDATVRETILRVLGRLENPAALPALVEELADPTTAPACVRQAAQSLGAIGAQGRVEPERIAPAVEPLKKRFESAPDGDLRLKEALLAAMASIGDPAFTSDFVDNLSVDAPELVLAAIRGIKTVGARDHLDRLIAHLTHVDPRVRQRSAEAVGVLGDQAALDALFNRLSPNVESNEGVRDAAWDGFRAILARSPADVRLQWANRLSELHDRQVALLNELIDAWTADGSAAPELVQARERLVDIYLADGNYADCINQLQQLRKQFVSQDDPRAQLVELQLVRATLEAGRHDRIVELVRDVAAGEDAQARAKIADTIVGYLDAAIARDPNTQLSALVDRLETLPPALLTDDWSARLAVFRKRIADAQNATTPAGEHHTP